MSATQFMTAGGERVSRLRGDVSSIRRIANGRREAVPHVGGMLIDGSLCKRQDQAFSPQKVRRLTILVG